MKLQHLASTTALVMMTVEPETRNTNFIYWSREGLGSREG